MAYFKCSGGGSTEPVLEEDRDYEWDFTRSEHPELDINYGEPIWIENVARVSYSNNGLVIGNTGVSVPLGNTEVQYWEQEGSRIGKTIEIDIVEIGDTRKPSTPGGGGRNYVRMFVGTDLTIGMNRNGNGVYNLSEIYANDNGLTYVQKASPQDSGWTLYGNNAWGNTLTPETEAYDSIGYFNGKTLKFVFSGNLQGNKYEYYVYVNDVLLGEDVYGSKGNLMKYYLPEFIIHHSSGMYNMTISGVRVYKNQWYEPKFQPEQQGGD